MRIGRYETERELGRGAMGVVFAARDPDGRRVAVKLLLPGSGTRERRFEREIEALVRMRHDNVVRLLDAGEHQSFPYLVTELIEGETLEDRLARHGPLDPRIAAAIVRDVARGVAHAHAQNVLHRDLKPSNVLVEPSGRARVVDFGLTRDVATPGSLTRTGQLMGTPGFWAPEQARGKTDLVGPATDVYGIGATLYAALTGDPPARGGTIAELLVATCDMPARSPSSVRAGIDRDLADLCLRCLEKAPADRLATAAQVADALDAWLAGGGRPRADGRLVAALALCLALVVVLAIAVAVLALSRPAEPLAAVPPPTATEPPPRPAPVVDDRAAAVSALTSRGWSRLRARDRDGARASFDEALAADPRHVPALLGRARAYWSGADAARAREDLARAVELAPDDPEVLVTRGTFRLGSEDDRADPVGARADFERALRLDPRNAGAYEGRAMTHEDLHDAVRDYLKAIELGARHATLYHNLAMARAELGDRGEPDQLARAIEDLGQAIALEPGEPAARVERARLHRQRGAPEEALADLDEAMRLEETADALVERAHLKRDLDQLPAARADLERAVVLSPDVPHAWYELGRLCETMEDLPRAQAAYTRVIDLDPGGPGWVRRGVVRMRLGDVLNGRLDLDRAVAGDRGDSQACYERGKALLELRDWAGAAEDFERLAQLEPTDPWAPYEKGKALQGSGDLTGAVVEYERALKRNPRFAPALVERGRVKDLRGDRPGALADWREALRHAPPASPERADAEELLRAAEPGR